MSLSHETLLDLMAYADGEADAAVSSRVEALVAESAEAREVLASMRGAGAAVGAWIASEANERASSAGAGSIAGAVMDKIAADGVAPRNVSSLAAARARRGGAGRATIALAAVAALAAAVLLYARSRQPAETSPIATMAPSETAPVLASASASSEPPEPLMANAEPPEVKIKSTTSHDVSVLVLPAAAAANANESPASVIVWVGDNPGGKN